MACSCAQVDSEGALKRTRTGVSRAVTCSPSCTGPLQRTTLHQCLASSHLNHSSPNAYGRNELAYTSSPMLIRWFS